MSDTAKTLLVCFAIGAVFAVLLIAFSDVQSLW
jgi:hypothetical protein